MDSDGPNPDVSIVVTTRNRDTLLRRLLDRLVSLDPGPAYEVLVVDEGSSDGTPGVLDEFRDRYGVRSVRHDDPVGLPAARNVGIAATTGTHVAWIDDDDLTSPDRLRRQWEALRDGRFRWSCAGRVDIDDALRVIGHVRCPPGTGTLPSLLRWNSIPAAAQGLLVERDLLDEVGPFDVALRAAEDWEMCIRLADRSAPHLLDEPLVGYRTGVASMSTDTSRMDTAIDAVIPTYLWRFRKHGEFDRRIVA